MATLAALTEQLRTGGVTADQVLDDCLTRIDDPAGEGRLAFLGVYRESARATARAMDQLRQAGVPVPLLAGVPLSVKDLFDVAGDSTPAGSRVLRDRPPATRDATAIARLRAAGAVLVGRTNMTEFAYSGVGLNPHFGTPANPYDRVTRRLPGGSTSGGVVSITDGMALGAIGSDTGGSCRIPAALCGLAGYKPTQHRIPLDGVVPLSGSYDSVGAMAPTVECVGLLDAVMAGERMPALISRPVHGARLLVVENVLLDDLDTPTSTAFERALAGLERAGAVVDRVRLDALDALPELTYSGGLVAAEAYAWHKALLERRGQDYDPRVRQRIVLGGEQRASDYIGILAMRRELQTRFAAVTRAYDAVVAPTTPMVAPPISALDDDADFTRINKLMLRNPSLANMLDCPSVTVPCQEAGALPVGFMLIGPTGRDRETLGLAASVETCLGATEWGAPR